MHFIKRHIAFSCFMEEGIWGKDKEKFIEGPGLKPVLPQIVWPRQGQIQTDHYRMSS